MKYLPLEKTKKDHVKFDVIPGYLKNNQFQFIPCFSP